MVFGNKVLEVVAPVDFFTAKSMLKSTFQNDLKTISKNQNIINSYIHKEWWLKCEYSEIMLN